jgi:tRNA(Ile)-lysidine synthase
MGELSPLAFRVNTFAEEHDLVPKGSTVIAAVSGGPDSVALLHLLRELASVRRLQLIVAHFQHSLRGEESSEDEAFVRALSDQLGLRFARGEGMTSSRGSLEARAREARYRFLEEARSECGADLIATGHTADDQVETVLLRLCRGAGPVALAGMAPRRGSVVRPLLSVWRREVLEYLRRAAHSYRLDLTNLAACAERNRLRHSVVPAWEETLGPWISQGIFRSSCNLREAGGYIEDELGRMDEAVCVEGEQVTALDLSAFGQYHSYLQGELLLRVIERLGVPARSVGREGVLRLLQIARQSVRATRVVLPGGVEGARSGATLYVRRTGTAPAGPFSFRLQVPGQVGIPPTGKVLRARAGAQRPEWYPGDGTRRICVPLTAMGGRGWLLVRNRRPGDKLGLRDGASKRLKEVLREGRIPLWERGATPVVVGESGVMWVVGVRRAWMSEQCAGSQGFLTVEAIQGGVCED